MPHEPSRPGDVLARHWLVQRSRAAGPRGSTTTYHTNKALLKFMDSQGIGADDKTVAYESGEVDRLTALLDNDKSDSPPTGSKLDRAERQLKKANLAREALEKELEEINEAYDRQLDQFDLKWKSVEARIATHTASIKRIRSQLGGPAKIPKKIGKGISSAVELLGSVGPALSRIFDMVKDDPRILGEGIDPSATLQCIGSVFERLNNCDKDEWPTASSDSEEEGDDDEEEEEDDDEALEEEDGDMLADNNPPGETDGVPADGAQPAPPAPLAAPAPPPPAPPGPASPSGQSDSAAQQQQPSQPAPAPHDGLVAADDARPVGATGKTDSLAVQAARERKRTAAQARPKDDKSPTKHDLVNIKGKVKPSKPPIAGGATAPTPTAMQESSMQVEDGGEEGL